MDAETARELAKSDCRFECLPMPHNSDTCPLTHNGVLSRALLASSVAKEIRSRYTIGYIPTPDSGSATRRIQVSAKAEGNGKLRAHVRESYRYEELIKNKSTQPLD